MGSIDEIKEKFAILQDNVTKLNNSKIGLESEIKTIDADLKELGTKLLEITGKTTVEEAFTYYKEQNKLLEEKKEKMLVELDGYLNLDKDS
jgi:predicted  nucleic acid-binding Zn-ribbon protein